MTLIHALNTAPQKPGIKNVIATQAFLFLPNTQDHQAQVQAGLTPLRAVWDTGATHTTICVSIAQSMGLPPISVRQTQTANGPKQANVYLADLALPNGVVIKDLPVSDADFTGTSPRFEVLIGMDIINIGDFSITNFQGNTVMNFRIPSIEEHDFVAHARIRNVLTSKSAAVGKSSTHKKKKKHK